MPSIGEGSAFVALLPGALETLVSNIKTRFAAATHTHGTSGIEDGAVTPAKLSTRTRELIDAAAVSGPPATVLFDASTDGAVELTTSTATVQTDVNPTSFDRIRVTWSLGSQSHRYSCEIHPSQYTYTQVPFVDGYDSGSRVTMHVLRIGVNYGSLTLRIVGTVALVGDAIAIDSGNSAALRSIEGWR